MKISRFRGRYKSEIGIKDLNELGVTQGRTKMPRLVDLHKHFFKLMISLILVSGFSNDVWAFKISPCLRVLKLENGNLTEEAVLWKNKCGIILSEDLRSAVHEHMTLASILQYRRQYDPNILGYSEPNAADPKGWKYHTMREPKWNFDKKIDCKDPSQNFQFPCHQTAYLIFGSWWNDDPLMRTWGQNWNFFMGVLRSRKLIEPDQKQYATDKSCYVAARKHLGHESHYGSLQHLHYMTGLSGKDSSSKARAIRIRNTTNLAIKWMKFAYEVATDKIPPSTLLSFELEYEAGLPPIYLNKCKKVDEDIYVRDLFSRDDDTSQLERDNESRDVALGSMLHLIQDSWSASHTCRIKQSKVSEAGTKVYALISDVQNYSEQINDDNGGDFHSLQDLYPEWLKERVIKRNIEFDNDPVNIGAWLLEAVDRKLPWDEVDKHLRETIFASDESEAARKDDCLFKRPTLRPIPIANHGGII